MRSAVRHQPLRTCVGCRERAAKSSLVRVVLVAGRLTVDENQTLSGRGAYLHPACAAQAAARKAFNRSFRTELDSAGWLATQLEEQMANQSSQPSETGV